MAFPDIATQHYLYNVSNNGDGKLTRITPLELEEINTCDVSPNCKFAIHNFTNVNTPNNVSLVNLSKHKTSKELFKGKFTFNPRY